MPALGLATPRRPTHKDRTLLPPTTGDSAETWKEIGLETLLGHIVQDNNYIHELPFMTAGENRQTRGECKEGQDNQISCPSTFV